MRKHMRGMTLMELMIVVVIIGILAAIAYPNYRSYVAKAKRNEAKADLLQIATLQERFYLQNNTYTTDMSVLGFAAAGCNLSDTGTYDVCVNNADANTFDASATYQIPGDVEAPFVWNADPFRGKASSFFLPERTTFLCLKTKK